MNLLISGLMAAVACCALVFVGTADARVERVDTPASVASIDTVLAPTI